MVKPIPIPDELSKPFWDACNERRLVVQYCEACNRMQYPPEKACFECGLAHKLGWREVKGRGTIHSHMVMSDTRLRVMLPDQPFNVVLIALEENPAILFISNLPGTPVDQVPAGAQCEVEFVEVAPGQLIHEWRLVS